MLSPHTPPGTKVVCINADDLEGYLREGEVYTVHAILHPQFVSWKIGAEWRSGIMHGVELAEVASPNAGFHPRRFRRAELPSCLTELLNTETV